MMTNTDGLRFPAPTPEPIAITHVSDHAITAPHHDWTTIQEELYNNISVFDTAQPLQKGKQHIVNKDGTEQDVEYVVTWTNTYGDAKTRVFATTLGHKPISSCLGYKYDELAGVLFHIAPKALPHR